MPRNASGTYTLPAGNPVVTATTIASNWANTTLSDVAAEMTNSLARDGAGGMTGALRVIDGVEATPGFAFGSETGTGFYRAGAGDWRAAVGGTQVYKVTATALTLASGKTLDVTSNATIGGTLAVTGVLTATGGVTGNASTATALANTRTIWGQNFNGTGNVSGAITGATTIAASSDVTVGGTLGVTGATTLAAASATNLSYTGTLTGSTGVLNIGSGQVYKDASGDVGLGTTSPTFGSGTGLEIQRAGIATLRLENSTASNSFELYADSAANGINLRGRDSTPIVFWTANTERARIFASGGVSIGNTTDPGATNLSVTGSVKSGAATLRALTAGTGITITNADGASGNPTITNAGVTSVNGSTGAVTVTSPSTAFDGVGSYAILYEAITGGASGTSTTRAVGYTAAGSTLRYQSAGDTMGTDAVSAAGSTFPGTNYTAVSGTWRLMQRLTVVKDDGAGTCTWLGGLWVRIS